MNLTYVKNYLTTKKDNITSEDVQALIDEINTYLGVSNDLSDISKVMYTINSYNVEYIKCVEEFNCVPKGRKHLIEQIDKAREILCILSTLHTYIIISLSNISDNNYDLTGVRKYLKDLSEKKEHFKSEKMAWVTILKSLSQEASFIMEMRKLKIEENMGYIGERGFNGKKT